MRGLKALVIVMGIMLVGGFAALVAVIAVRVSHRPGAVSAPRAVSGAPIAVPPISLPAGARVEAVGGGAERIVVALVLPDGSRELLLIDPASGRTLGKIPLQERK